MRKLISYLSLALIISILAATIYDTAKAGNSSKTTNFGKNPNIDSGEKSCKLLGYYHLTGCPPEYDCKVMVTNETNTLFRESYDVNDERACEAYLNSAISQLAQQNGCSIEYAAGFDATSTYCIDDPDINK